MDPFLGEIRMVGFNFAPNGWALCNGQLLAISSNTALFSLLGTTFGGNGVSTFGLPNLQSRVPIHQGQGVGLSVYTMGEMAGFENITLITNQIPAHNHLMAINNANANQTDPTGGLLSKTNNGDRTSPLAYPTYSNAASTGNLANNAISMTGGNLPHSNLQPFLVVNFIIALNGIFPSRS
jgi:microcystin-dependent protein